MPKEITIKVYTIDELTGKAKEKALHYMREHYEYPWCADNDNSLKSFVTGILGQRFADICHCGVGYVWNSLEYQEQFDEMKIENFDRDNMPTGYCMDNTLWMKFHDVFKETGNAMKAFKEALDAFQKAVQDDLAFAYEDEQLIEHANANEYLFMVDGKRIVV